MAQPVVAKLIVIDGDNNYLLLHRGGGHPLYPNDPDVPGGSLESGEQPIDTMLREIDEEVGLKLDADATKLLANGDSFSDDGTMYYVYETRLNYRPDVMLSWEHETYAWVSRKEFIVAASEAIDVYMHMVESVVAAQA